jgi:ComF family protein
VIAGAGAGAGEGPGLATRAGRLATALRAARDAVLDLALPRCCVACGRPVGAATRRAVCGVCWSRVERLPAPRCERCGHPMRAQRCYWCAQLPAYVRAARSVCWVPGGVGGRVVHALKYDGWTIVAGEMAEEMARLAWPADVVAERTAIVPVPLGRRRLRERGYNQSLLLARELSTRWRIPVWERCVERGRETRSQTRLTPGERLGNVSNAFRVAAIARDRLRGSHLVLVDDVVTTGATLDACAAALFESGTRILSYVTFGRAPTAGDR